MKTAIEVRDLTKIFRVYHDKRFKEVLISFVKRRPIYENLVALKNLNFKVEKGECLGIIGINGSGKSTILKLLAGVLWPDNGGIDVTGKISTLIALDSGLHDDLTGLENIYLNAALFGLTLKEIKEKVPDIINFSGLSKFIDTQTRHYSNGMKARLGFSIAIHTDSDILLVDEALAVGDKSFKEQCYTRIVELKRKGVSMVYVSHEMDSIKSICDKALWLEHGMIRYMGRPGETIDAYLKSVPPNIK
jgi:ABC-2 type transport system ATP-binding protein/lipopolysaccharide transport system ATP-binding protein